MFNAPGDACQGGGDPMPLALECQPGRMPVLKRGRSLLASADQHSVVRHVESLAGSWHRSDRPCQQAGEPMLRGNLQLSPDRRPAPPTAITPPGWPGAGSTATGGTITAPSARPGRWPPAGTWRRCGSRVLNGDAHGRACAQGDGRADAVAGLVVPSDRAPGCLVAHMRTRAPRGSRHSAAVRWPPWRLHHQHAVPSDPGAERRA